MVCSCRAVGEVLGDGPVIAGCHSVAHRDNAHGGEAVRASPRERLKVPRRVLVQRVANEGRAFDAAVVRGEPLVGHVHVGQADQYVGRGRAPCPGVPGRSTRHAELPPRQPPARRPELPARADAAQSAAMSRCSSTKPCLSASVIPRHHRSDFAYASLPQRCSTSSLYCVWSKPSNRSSAMICSPFSSAVMVRSTTGDLPVEAITLGAQPVQVSAQGGDLVLLARPRRRDVPQTEPELAQQQDPLQPDQGRVVVVAVPVVADRGSARAARSPRSAAGCGWWCP